MITFLRKIRRSLIQSGSARKYLLYAIGEISLVVIGILIALQINTWNSNRLDRQLEKEYIYRLTNELKSEITQLKRVQEIFQEKRDRLMRLVKIWNSDQYIITDSLEYINDFKYAGSIGPWYNEPITWTQLIQSGDLKLIKDQKLIDMLFAYYNRSKKMAQNYEQHPMSMTNEARRLSPPIFLDDETSLLFGAGAQFSKVIPPAIIYQRIYERKDDMKDLFTTIAFISNVTQVSIGKMAEQGQDLITYLETGKE